MAPPTGPRVLAVSADARHLREIRLVAPLSALERAGRIAGFRILNPLDGSLSGHGAFAQCDAVILQRDVPPAVVRFLTERGLPFVLDVDDLLTGRAAYRDEAASPEAARRVALAAEACAVLTVTNPRLLAALERHLGRALAAKTVVVPNALPLEHPPARVPARPQGLLWTSSDLPALTASAGAVLAAVREFAARRALPVLLAGTFSGTLAGELPGARFLGHMDYWRHKCFLLEAPTWIGIAPLETEADPDTLEFIACKSDVKMVEYGGLGHPGVYSRAVPYARSELRAGLLAENTRQAWLDALESLYGGGFARAADEARDIFAARAVSKVARECWAPVLEAVRLARPLDVADLRRTLFGGPWSGRDVEPLHHRLADALYLGLYSRLVPEGLKRRVGRLVEAALERRRGGVD